MTETTLKNLLEDAVPGFRQFQRRQLEGLDETDYELFLRTLFPEYMKYPFAERHRLHWEWVWALQPGIRPDPLIEIWSRGGAKSTSAELTCPVVGALRLRGYAIYVSGTQQQADDHVATISAMLESEIIQHYYRDLSQREVTQFGDPKGWRRNRLWTARGLIVDALGLESKSIRGLKKETKRPDLIILDDIDARHDSVDLVAKKSEMLKDSILPAGSNDVAVLGVQNLIHRNSIFASLQVNGGADFLLKRTVSGPFKAIEDWPDKPIEGVHYERRGEPYYILKGTASWAGQDIKTCEANINDWSFPTFMREAQHVVNTPQPGALFPAYQDAPMHVIARSKFQDFYDAYDHEGNPMMVPPRGYVTWTQDWGTTHAHPCVTLFGWKPAQEMLLSDCFFIFYELGFPETIYSDQKDNEPEPVAPTPVGQAIADLLFRQWFITPDRIKHAVMSHEASAACNTYNALKKYTVGYPNLTVGKWKVKPKGGTDEIQDYLEVRLKRADGSPFRHPFNSDVVGCPRIFFVVDDDQVARPRDGKGLRRLRAEIPEYRNPTSTAGIEKDKPLKWFDDGVDALRMMADVNWPRAQKRTREQRIDEEMPAKFRTEVIESLSPAEKDQAVADSYWAYHKAQRKVDQAERPLSRRQAIKDKYRSRTRTGR